MTFGGDTPTKLLCDEIDGLFVAFGRIPIKKGTPIDDCIEEVRDVLNEIKDFIRVNK